MKDREIVKARFINGAFTKTIVVYESGLVKENNVDYKKIDIADDIVKYLNYVKQHGFEKSKLDDRCKIEYANEIYNSGIVYSTIELMIRNNCPLEVINTQNENTRINEKEQKKELDKKLKVIAENKSKILDFCKNRPRLDITSLSNNDINTKRFEAIKFSLKQKESFDIGETRILSKYIDVPEGLKYPNELEFLAQINLSDLSKYDNSGLLPKTGNLYFFQGPMIDGTYFECGKVIYSDDDNLVRKNVFVYDNDMILELGIDDVIVKQDVYSENNDKENKIFGIYSDPQLTEKDIIKVSNKYLILLQLGWDIYGEGVITFLISENDLINKDFSKVIYTYSQT